MFARKQKKIHRILPDHFSINWLFYVLQCSGHRANQGQLVWLIQVHYLYRRVNAFTYLLKHNKYKAVQWLYQTHKLAASWFNASFVSSFKKIRRTNSSTCHTWLMFRLQTTCHDSLYSHFTASSSRHSVSPSVCYIDAFVLPAYQESCLRSARLSILSFLSQIL